MGPKLCIDISEYLVVVVGRSCEDAKMLLLVFIRSLW